MDISIEYFARFREQAGTAGEQLSAQNSSVAALYNRLAERYGFELPRADVKVAVNDEFVDWSYQLQDGDRLVFIPPVAGG